MGTMLSLFVLVGNEARAMSSLSSGQNISKLVVEKKNKFNLKQFFK
jgi:hypothetical protein